MAKNISVGLRAISIPTVAIHRRWRRPMNRRTGRLLWRVAAALLWALSQMACNPSFGQAPPISHADASIQSEGLAAQPSFAIPDTHQLDNGHGPHVVRM